MLKDTCHKIRPKPKTMLQNLGKNIVKPCHANFTTETHAVFQKHMKQKGFYTGTFVQHVLSYKGFYTDLSLPFGFRHGSIFFRDVATLDIISCVRTTFLSSGTI